MTNAVLLNDIDHRDLRVVTRHGAEFGDNVNQVLIFPTEFEDIQREYAIFFTPGDDGVYQSVALLGFDRDENLYLDDSGWDARYIPAVQRRGPFSIGVSHDDSGSAPMIHVDLDHRRISRDAGHPLFLPEGGNAPYLDHVADVLDTIYSGIDLAAPMFAAFEAAGLIEPVAVEIELSETESYSLPDYSTISAERLDALDGAALAALHAQGFLYPAFLVVASLGNVNGLIERKNARLAAQ